MDIPAWVHADKGIPCRTGVTAALLGHQPCSGPPPAPPGLLTVPVASSSAKGPVQGQEPRFCRLHSPSQLVPMIPEVPAQGSCSLSPLCPDQRPLPMRRGRHTSGRNVTRGTWPCPPSTRSSSPGVPAHMSRGPWGGVLRLRKPRSSQAIHLPQTWPAGGRPSANPDRRPHTLEPYFLTEPDALTRPTLS